MSQKPPAGGEDQDREEKEESAISHARAYTAPGVTVFYNRGRCLHFAECLRGLPQVFDVAKRPWLRPGNASADEGAEEERRCGRTENEPFCDNACSRTGWTSEPRARDRKKLREMTEFVALGRAEDVEV